MATTRRSLFVGLFSTSFLFTLVQAAGGAGSVECPCASSEWDGFERLREALRRREELPADYGLSGCNAYDVGLNASGCAGSEPKPEYCAAKWCYVDTTKCPVNQEECEAQGLLLGTRDPACRSRPMVQGTVVPEGHYSYETCGSLDNYGTTRATETIGTRRLIAAVADSPPWVSHETRGGVTEYFGVIPTFMDSILREFAGDQRVDLYLHTGWATEESRAKFPESSWSACVHDVAVGNFDMCIGDFWVTAERMLITNFLPPFTTHNFYLLVIDNASAVSFAELLRNPFKPFSNEAWAVIAAVVVFKALVEALLDFGEEEEPGATRTPFASRCVKAFYAAWISAWSGASRFKGGTLPAQLSNMGFQMFLLILVASYKASLASMLILRADPAISSLDDAINNHLTICIPSAIESTFRLNYQEGDFLAYDGDEQSFARLMHQGICSAMIGYQQLIDVLNSGAIHRADCEAVERGELTEEEGRCKLGIGGRERHDCDIRRVGEVLMTVPVSFPISNDQELARPLGWALTKAQLSGEWQAAVAANRHLFPPDECGSLLAESATLGKESFAAPAFFVAVAAVIGVVARFALQWSGQGSQAGGPPSDAARPVSEASADAGAQRGAGAGAKAEALAKLAEAMELLQREEVRVGEGEVIYGPSSFLSKSDSRPLITT